MKNQHTVKSTTPQLIKELSNLIDKQGEIIKDTDESLQRQTDFLKEISK